MLDHFVHRVLVLWAVVGFCVHEFETRADILTLMSVPERFRWQFYEIHFNKRLDSTFSGEPCVFPKKKKIYSIIHRNPPTFPNEMVCVSLRCSG